MRPGEIIALAGPVGSGKEDLALVLAGQQEPATGAVGGADGTMPTIGYVPTDRHASGYVGILGVREHVTLGGLEVLSGNLGFISKTKEDGLVSRLTRQTDVIASSLDQAVSQLSGGNQQKVVFARALCRDPQIIVALSPTRGVDVGAKEQLYALLRDLASKGLGVIGLTFVLLIGRLDLSLEGVVGFAPMLAAVMLVPVTAGGFGVELPQWMGLIVALGCAGLIGVINNLLTLAQIPSFYVQASTGAVIIIAAILTTVASRRSGGVKTRT